MAHYAGAHDATGDLRKVAPFLALIGSAEGTDKGDGYNETLAYGAFSGGDVMLVTSHLAGAGAATANGT